MYNVYLVGSKSIGSYGGYETFVDKLTEYHQNNKNIKYHIACKANGEGCMDETKLSGVNSISDEEFIYHNAYCFKIRVPNIGSAQAIYYDIVSLFKCCDHIKKNKIKNPIIYIMACRIGPVMPYFIRKVHRLGGEVYVNPDGHEWMRAKWSSLVRKYWKVSERLMIRNCDLVICDSVNIRKYIHESYDKKNIRKMSPSTTYIAYGAETRNSIIEDHDSRLLEWCREKDVAVKKYYLVVGRFVPENNFETMIREFMRSNSKHDFVLITNVSEKFLLQLKDRTGFDKDNRIKFVGTVYDKELLMKIRENAYGYFHGHEVGGTNPSLLEALGSTKLNLLLDVGFNREVGENAALYWDKSPGNLARLIEKADTMSVEEIDKLGKRAKNRIESAYSWKHIADEYEKIWERKR